MYFNESSIFDKNLLRSVSDRTHATCIWLVRFVSRDAPVDIEQIDKKLGCIGTR